MAEFILFVLILGVWWHSANTKARLEHIANTIDEVNQIFNNAFQEDRDRLDALEAKKK